MIVCHTKSNSLEVNYEYLLTVIQQKIYIYIYISDFAEIN